MVGSYRVVSVHPWSALLPPLAIAVMSGYTEEVVFRGVFLRIAEESLGMWIALLISSVLFATVHATNPGASVFSTVAIFLEAGVLLGAAHILTRRLWIAVGIHFGEVVWMVELRSSTIRNSYRADPSMTIMDERRVQ